MLMGVGLCYHVCESHNFSLTANTITHGTSLRGNDEPHHLCTQLFYMTSVFEKVVLCRNVNAAT